MRVFKRILYILLVIVFVFSVITSVIFAVSSPTTLKNSISSRRKIFYTSINDISNSKNITITSKTPYNLGGANQQVEDKITCSLDNETTTYKCTMISRLYNENSKLVRTSYFPGDGYKYTLEDGDNTGTKTPSSDSVVTSYFASLISGAQNYLSILTYDSKTIETYSVKYNKKIHFNFNTFSLSKSFNVSYTIGSQSVNAKLIFDKKDRLSKLQDVTNKSSMSISYNKAKLDFPSFIGYIEQ